MDHLTARPCAFDSAGRPATTASNRATHIAALGRGRALRTIRTTLFIVFPYRVVPFDSCGTRGAWGIVCTWVEASRSRFLTIRESLPWPPALSQGGVPVATATDQVSCRPAMAHAVHSRRRCAEAGALLREFF